MFGVHDLDGDEVVVESEVTNKAGEKRNIVEEAVAVTDVVTIPVSAARITNVKGQGSKDKGKAKMIEPEKPLKKKDQIKFDEEDRLAREKAQQVEEANIAWDDIQAKIDADYQLAKRLQAQEQQELTIEEKSTLFQQLLEKRRKFFTAKRGIGHLQELNKGVLYMDTELVEGSEVRAEGSETREESSSKRAGDELEQEKAKKQKVDDDQEAAKMKELMKIVPDEEEVAVDAIPLATKPPSIVDYKIIKEGKISYYQIIRADGSSKRYSAFIQMLRSFDREDLETLWKLVKAKHGYTRPEEGYERVLWGDLKTMFEHHVEDLVWRNLQGNKVLVWKLFDSCGVYFARFQSLHVFMLVEKRYPLTPATIIEMLNQKLQADHWNEMCYQLLKLITKQLKNHEVFGSIFLVINEAFNEET
ncbi:hypothetical protein Tco_0991923 [Tanacetum coccineum]|uniref:Uncharacterized protein n=1 Tax=Tanacetum coccineum TaxID=301880 RepID=A0ABQ5F1Q3_9ASTR